MPSFEAPFPPPHLKKARDHPQAGSDKSIHPQWVDEAGLRPSPGIGVLYKQLRESGPRALEKASPLAE